MTYKRVLFILIFLMTTLLSFGQERWSVEFGFGNDLRLEKNKYSSQNFEPRISMALFKKTSLKQLELFIVSSYDRYSMNFTPSKHPRLCWVSGTYDPIQINDNRLDVSVGQQLKLFEIDNFQFKVNTSVGFISSIYSSWYYLEGDIISSTSQIIGGSHYSWKFRGDIGMKAYYQINDKTSIGLGINYAQFFNRDYRNLGVFYGFDPQKIINISIRKC